MKLNLPHKIKATGIRTQILKIFFFAAICPLLLVGIFSVYQARKQMMTHYVSQVEAEGLRVNSILFDVTTSLYTASQRITNNQKTMSIFSTTSRDNVDKAALSELEESVLSIKNTTASISSIQIYTNNPNFPASPYVSVLTSYTGEEWYTMGGDHWSVWTSLNRKDRFGNNVYELSLIRRIGVVGNQYTAYLVIRLDNNYLRNRIDVNNYKVNACVDDLPAFYSPNTWDNTKITFPEDFEGGFYHYTGFLDTGEGEILSNYQTFQPYKTNNLFYVRVNDTQAVRNINQITGYYLFIILLAVIAPTIIILVFSSYFSKRINTLKAAMHQASLGDYNIIDNFSGDDELKDTFSDLKTTVELIYQKEAQFYEAKIKEQKLINRQQQMEFEILASQINPHFLYNTLETIRMQALANGNRDVAASIKLLGKSMHYVLENTGTSFTTLTKELDYVKTYLAIQNLRFGDRVNPLVTVAENINTDDYMILPLLLQPVVENAVIHGLEKVKEHGYVTINVRAENDNLIITVSDNGSGMEEETLKNLMEHIQTHDPNDKRSIGLYNINQRIHLLYGQEYGLTIESVSGEGTTVTLTLPDSPLETE